MNPKNMHILCDILLLIPLLGILISLFVLSNSLKDDVYIIKQLFDEWNNKPIQILQESYRTVCSEMGMSDLIFYEFPGITKGCICENKKIYENTCDYNKLNQCSDIPEIKGFHMKKWKGSFLCGSSIKPKNYFELNITPKNEKCSQRYKKCGIIDTLDNYLCVPENEICPLNKINFMSGLESVRIDTSNKNLEGKIYTSFKIAENRLCLNNNQRFFSENNYRLIKKISYLTDDLGVDLNLNGCSTYITDSAGKYHYANINYEIIDSEKKSSFYKKDDNIIDVLGKIPGYANGDINNINSDMFLFASVYPGWKTQCDKKEFKNYLKSNREKEILLILEKTNENDIYFIIYSIISIILFSIGVGYIKYTIHIGTYNKYEYSLTSSAIISIFYLGILFSNISLLYFSDFNLDHIKNAKLSTNFFELITNNNCSDDITNSQLKYVAKQFFSFANKYFNVKVLSFLVVVITIINILICILMRQSGESFSRKSGNKKKSN